MKKAALSAGLVAIKGSAAPVQDMPTRSTVTEEARLEPLNFKVPPHFRQAFRRYAFEHNLKLNRLLMLCFEAYQRDK